MNITYDQAICMLFYKECNEENAKQCKKEIDQLGTHGFQVCYEEDPSKPLLVSKLRVLGDPIHFHTYPDDPLDSNSSEADVKADASETSSLADSVVPNRDTEIKSEPPVTKVEDDEEDSAVENAKMCAFINKVFLSRNPESRALYSKCTCSSNSIFNDIKKYTVFDDKSLFAFHHWSRQQSLDFWKAEKYTDHFGETCFYLYVLDKQYFDEAFEAATKEAAKLSSV
ncbi:hypothetical protein MBANPS3_006244 [Mucor bainieri]